MEINFLHLNFPAFSFNPSVNYSHLQYHSVLLSLFLNYLDFYLHCYCHLRISTA